MAVSKLTMLEIYGNYPDNISTGAARDLDSENWAGYIYMMKHGQIHKVMISTKPVFDSEKDAVSYMDRAVNLIVEEAEKV